MRKSFLALTIGTDPERSDLKVLYVAKHRLDRSRFPVEIISDYSRALLYDVEATAEYLRSKRSEQ